MEYIAYKSDYKYQLTEQYAVKLPITPNENIVTDYIDLDVSGNLVIKKGYAWDGPSGPTIDTLNYMRGSLVHDALYQLMRGQELDIEKYREPADKILQSMCKEDGMSSLRAWLAYNALKFFGKNAAHYKSKKETIHAPRFVK